MTLTEACRIALLVNKEARHLPEQIRMNSSEDVNSYIVLIRLSDGTMQQVDDAHPWPILEPEVASTKAE